MKLFFFDCNADLIRGYKRHIGDEVYIAMGAYKRTYPLFCNNTAVNVTTLGLLNPLRREYSSKINGITIVLLCHIEGRLDLGAVFVLSRNVSTYANTNGLVIKNLHGRFSSLQVIGYKGVMLCSNIRGHEQIDILVDQFNVLVAKHLLHLGVESDNNGRCINDDCRST